MKSADPGRAALALFSTAAVLCLLASLAPPDAAVSLAYSARRAWGLCDLGGQLLLPEWGVDPWGNSWRWGYKSQADKDFVANNDPTEEGVNWPDLSPYSTGPNGVDEAGLGDDIFPRHSTPPVCILEFATWTGPYSLSFLAWILVVRDPRRRVYQCYRAAPIVLPLVLLFWRSRGVNGPSLVESAVVTVWVGISEAIGRGVICLQSECEDPRLQKTDPPQAHGRPPGGNSA